MYYDQTKKVSGVQKDTAITAMDDHHVCILFWLLHVRVA
jgi:hypothetical protein